MTIERGLTCVLVGASGDLARRKVVPAFFSLYAQRLIPEDLVIIGIARSPLSTESFREMLGHDLTCRYTPKEHCAEVQAQFLRRCWYVQGSYDNRESFLDVFQVIREVERPGSNRIYYLAVPPFLCVPVARALAGAGLVPCGPEGIPWTRLVIEKPFGSDRATFDTLTDELSRVFYERQIYRMDHYLGKEVVQNLHVLRLANRIFDVLWSRDHVRWVHISWKEEAGIGRRGGYFDRYGIIRDVVQNHLLQILALTAMDPPEALTPSALQTAKVQVLRRVLPARRDRTVLGQYTRGAIRGESVPAYVEEPSVSPGSRTATYVATVLEIQTVRWEGVPFLLTAGKAMNGSHTEVRIRFRESNHAGLWRGELGRWGNELRIRIQPDEAIDLSVLTRVPGYKEKIECRQLDLRYREAFSEVIPEAYESLLLDVIDGNQSLFPGREEVAASWDCFSSLLEQIEREHVIPLTYEAGSGGPPAATELAERFGIA